MLKLFMTGDNHFGKKYNRYPEIREMLIQSRYDSLKRMIQKAEQEGCELFVVAGDLFDSMVTVDKTAVKKTAEILAGFGGTVLVLPGNHDYYTGEEKVWRQFEDILSSMEHNVVLLKEFRPYELECSEEKVVVYPALCQTKHSKQNNLGWIREAAVEQEGVINIGIAHGAIQGITPDLNQEYFLMTEQELSSIPVDVWLIGHTHIPYPETLSEYTDTAGYKIFNAGTHEQTDLSNRTEGLGFVLTIRKDGTKAQALARKFVSGRIRYYDLKAEINSHAGETLPEAIDKLVQTIDVAHEDSVVRLTFSGTLSQGDYENRAQIYQEKLNGFLCYEIEDSGLMEEISRDKIRSEYAETSFAAQFLELFTEDPVKMQMAYQLLHECGE